MDKGYIDQKRRKLGRSKAWIKFVAPKYYRGFNSLMKHLEECYQGENIRALRLAMELSDTFNKPQKDWVIEGAIKWLKYSTRHKISLPKMNTIAKRRYRLLERWNALSLAKEMGLTDHDAYRKAKNILKKTDLAPVSKSTLNKDYYEVVNALKDENEKQKYLIAAIPSPKELRQLSDFLMEFEGHYLPSDYRS